MVPAVTKPRGSGSKAQPTTAAAASGGGGAANGNGALKADGVDDILFDID